MFSLSLCVYVVALFSFVSGQSPTSSFPSSTSSVSAATHTVSIGAQGLVFTPNQLTAAVGDIIQFNFYPQNHSVARAEFKSPCIPYEDTGINKQGFWSGFQPVSVVLNNPPSYSVRVNDTAPIFFYCSAPGACIDDGMVGVINPNETETFDTQLAFAKNSSLMFSPGEYFPSEIVPSPATTSLAPTGTTTTTITPSATSDTLQTAKTYSTAPVLSPAAIAGISIAGAAVLIIALALLYMCGRQKTITELLSRNTTSDPRLTHHSITSSKPPHYDINGLGARYDRERTVEEGNGSFRSVSLGADEMRDERRDTMFLPIQGSIGRSRAGSNPSGHSRMGSNHSEGCGERDRRPSIGAIGVAISTPRRAPPVPESPGVRCQVSDFTPVARSPVYEGVFRPFFTDVPGPLRLVRRESETNMERERDRLLEIERQKQRQMEIDRERELEWRMKAAVIRDRPHREVRPVAEIGPHELSGGTPTSSKLQFGDWTRQRDVGNGMGGMI